jgi:hypothetical protein
MILSVTEWRYHPKSFPNGWDSLGGPIIESLDAVRTMETDERMDLLGLPPEPSWLEDVLREVRQRVADRFKVAVPQEPIV